MEEENIGKILEELGRLDLGHHIATIAHIAPLEKLLMDDPRKWIPEVLPALNKAFDEAYTDKNGTNNRSYISAIAGGPSEVCPIAAYNVFGAVYPYLERNEKNLVLHAVFNFLDKYNYTIVNMIHTPGVREPSLLSDILIVAPLYWPGIMEYKEKVQELSSFEQVRFRFMNEEGLFDKDKIQSDFLFAYTLLRSDMCDFGEQYIEAANKPFLERVVKSIVALRFGQLERHAKIKNFSGIEIGIKQAEATDRLKQLLPKSLHTEIEFYKNERDWVECSFNH